MYFDDDNDKKISKFNENNDKFNECYVILFLFGLIGKL